MSDITAPLFYADNFNGVREFYTSLTRAVVKGEKITLYEKYLMRAEKSENLYEHLSNTVTYTAHTNTHGVKYLKVQQKPSHFASRDMSLEVALDGTSFCYTPFLHNSKAYEDFLLKNVASWFGSTTTPEVLKEGFQLLFPVLNFEGVGELMLEALRNLERLSGDGARVATALRESENFHEAVKSLCGDTIQTAEDSELIKKHPNLMLVADLNLGMTLTAFVKMSPSIIEKLNSWPDLDLPCMKLMLNYLPEPKKGTILGILMDQNKSPLYRVSTSATPRLTHIESWQHGNHYVESCLPVIPEAKHEELAEELYKIFTLPLDALLPRDNESDCPPVSSYRTIQVRFRYWFSEHVLEPYVKSEVTLQDVENRISELFMPGCDHGMKSDCEHGKEVTGVQFLTDRNGTVFATAGSSLAGFFKSYLDEHDLVGGLHALSGWKDGALKVMHGSHCYLDERGQLHALEGSILPLDEFLGMIESGVRVVDKQLAKLGREVTPENRKAFVIFGHKDRKFKNTWRYYDLGITNARKVLALKSCGITRKRDIEMFAALPDEYFYELTELDISS